VVLKEFNAEPDHVHLLVNYPPKVRLSGLVNSLKGVSSRRMKQEFPAISTLWSIKKSHGALWSASYFARSVGGAPISILRHYIEEQNRPQAGAL
jgi:putative transposase